MVLTEGGEVQHVDHRIVSAAERISKCSAVERRCMVTFNLRVDAQFPVAGHFAFIAEDSAITIERITGELFLQSPELLVERQVGLLREIDEDKAFPKCNMDRHQPKKDRKSTRLNSSH